MSYIYIYIYKRGSLLLDLLDLLYFEHTQTLLTSIIDNSLSRPSIIFFSSSVDKPVFLFNWCTYVIVDVPLFLVPCFGSHTSICHANSCFLLHMCPMKFNLLTFSTDVSLLSFPCSSLFVFRSLQVKPATALSILG